LRARGHFCGRSADVTADRQTTDPACRHLNGIDRIRHCYIGNVSAVLPKNNIHSDKYISNNDDDIINYVAVVYYFSFSLNLFCYSLSTNDTSVGKSGAA